MSDIICQEVVLTGLDDDILEYIVGSLEEYCSSGGGVSNDDDVSEEETIDMNQQQQQQQQKKNKKEQDEIMETSMRLLLQKDSTIETIDELIALKEIEDGAIEDNNVVQDGVDGAAIQSSSCSNTTALKVKDDSTTPTTITTTTSDEYVKGERELQQKWRHQTIKSHPAYIISCCYCHFLFLYCTVKNKTNTIIINTTHVVIHLCQ